MILGLVKVGGQVQNLNCQEFLMNLTSLLVTATEMSNNMIVKIVKVGGQVQNMIFQESLTTIAVLFEKVGMLAMTNLKLNLEMPVALGHRSPGILY